MSDAIISKKQASLDGLKHYFTGTPCKRGHVSVRFVSTGVCLECSRESNRARKAYKADHYLKNRDAVILRVSEHYQKNKAKKIACCSAYQKKNLKRILEQRRLRAQSDPVYALKERVRGLIKSAISKNGLSGKRSATSEILGCTPEQFRRHIERQFLPRMTWENFGDWHLDHVVPISSAITEDDIYRLNHHTNLRPLWAADNMKKSGKMTHLI